MAVDTSRVEEIREYVADCKRTAEVHLDQGFASLETAVEIQLLIEQAAKTAAKYRLDAELLELRQICDRITAATCALTLDEIPFELDHGERPPTNEWRWSDYEKVIASSRACGLDVTEAEQALARARQVASSWTRGFDSPEHEEDVRQGRKPRGRRAVGLENITTAPLPGVTPASAHVQAPPRVPEPPIAREHQPPSRGTEPREAPVVKPAPPADNSLGRTAQQPAHPGPQRTTEAQPRESEPVADDAPTAAQQPATEAPVAEAESPTTSAPEEATQQAPSDPGLLFEPESAEPTKATNKVAPEPAPPRFALAADASPEDIQRHFAEVEAAIPPRLTGTATAVELWKAIHEAHRHGALPITGNWVDLVAALHRHGFLPHLSSDRASRAALVILAELSPLVRRLHHRRWVLGAER